MLDQGLEERVEIEESEISEESNHEDIESSDSVLNSKMFDKEEHE